MLYEQLNDNEFVVGNKRIHFQQTPALPFRIIGESWHIGWDIPTVFCVDGEGICYCDNAHGPDLVSRPVEQVLVVLREDLESRNKIRAAVGMKPEPEQWMKDAIRNNWTPPDTFNKDEYDWKENEFKIGWINGPEPELEEEP